MRGLIQLFGLLNVVPLEAMTLVRTRQIAQYRKSIDLNAAFAEGHLFLAKAYLDAGQQLD